MTGHAERPTARVQSLGVAGAVVALALLSFFWFPGHTMLQSDTQVYIPILEHLDDPAALTNDIMAVRPHVSYTLYDEMSRLLRAVTGGSFEPVLLAQQFVYRAIGIWGLYLIGTGMGFGSAASLVLAALTSLGAPVLGPAVLTVEYEPVPRGFAMPLLLLSMGALSHGRRQMAAGAAAIGFVLHPPTVLAYCAVLFGVLVWKREWRAMGILMVGPAALLLSLAGQPTAPERQALFVHVDPALERIQRMRAPYTFVSLWIGRWWKHYAILTVALAIAFSRIRELLPLSLRLSMTVLPIIGWVSLPISWFMFERMKWALIPQYQPARHLLFVTLFAVIACGVAAIWAGIQRRYVEAFLFSLVPLLAPQVSDLTLVTVRNLSVAAGLAVVLAAAMHWRQAAVAAAVLPFLLIPTLGGVVNYERPDTTDIDAVATWARSSTPKEAVFQFDGAGRQLTPGIFRARAVRALYADWKGGGQINFLRSFAMTWADRWKRVSKSMPPSGYKGLGIDYVVYPATRTPAGFSPVFSNAGWSVYRVPD